MSGRRIAMVGFLQARNCTNFPASWRHPESAGDVMSPFTVPPSPQGQPVIIRAGQSGRGRALAVRRVEVIFASYPNLELGARACAEHSRTRSLGVGSRGGAGRFG